MKIKLARLCCRTEPHMQLICIPMLPKRIPGNHDGCGLRWIDARYPDR